MKSNTTTICLVFFFSCSSLIFHLALSMEAICENGWNYTRMLLTITKALIIMNRMSKSLYKYATKKLTAGGALNSNFQKKKFKK